MNSYPDVRLRRYRRTEGLRRMFGTPLPGPEKFVWPVFVVEGQGQTEPIGAMPKQDRVSVDRLAAAVEPVAKSGVGGVLLFGIVDETRQRADAAAALDDDGVVQQAVRELRREFPDLLIFTDVCVCAYTTHGHCGLLTESGEVENDSTAELLARMAVSHAAAGADCVAPSAMMDGQVAAIRAGLRDAGLEQTLLMSYSTKFASAMYGPFREACDSAPGKGDRRGYQAPSHDFRQALRESEQDELEGADVLMVKPASLYLDVISAIRERSHLPVAAYNVSGEYSMLWATADRGWGDLGGMVRETTTALVRAGTDILISYWANQYEEFFGSRS